MQSELTESTSLAARAHLTHFALVAVLLALFPSPGHAGTWDPFGPEKFVRGQGAPTVFTRSFSILNLNTTYTLRINNGGLQGELARSSGTIMLNGVQIVSATEFNPRVSVIEKPIKLLLNNQLVIKLRAAPGSGIALQVIGVDNDPPVISGTVSPPPDAAGWNDSSVTVNFSCSDALSGVASCPSPVAVTTEGANQIVTGTATDKAGNTATANVTVNISFKFFTMRNYAGKCLDYGAAPNGSGATVFLNDCASAHPIRVEEINAKHEVVLHAGTSVIGIHNPPASTLGGPPSPTQTEYALELQTYNPKLATAANQIFALDGDSIILESSRPCINTVTTVPPFCPDPPPQLVIQIQNARGANGSPLVAGLRNLADNEFWDFNALDGSAKYPTAGFISSVGSPPAPIATADALWNAVCSSPVASPSPAPPPTSQCFTFNVGWGSVIVVTSPNDCTVTDPLTGQTQDIGGCIDLSGYPPIQLPAGVTILGNRRGTSFGPQLYAAYSSSNSAFDCDGTCMLEVQGDYARVTGLRVRGQSRSTDPRPKQVGKTDGIRINFAGTSPSGQSPQIPYFSLATVTELIAAIDHNDMSDWIDAAITVISPFSNGNLNTGNECSYLGYIDPASSPPNNYTCDENTQLVPYSPYLVSLNPNLSPVTIAEDPIGGTPGPGTLANIRVARNFLHHNMRDDGGYGVGVQGRALIDGNTFLMNRHDISSDGEPHHEYRASHNLVLSSAYEHYGFLGTVGRLQDFDMHGTANATVYDGGAGGYYVEIDGNTFLGSNGHDYVLRGYPAGAYSYYHNNVSLRKENDAIHFNHCVTGIGCVNDYHSPSNFPIEISSSQFADSSPPFTDPTASLRVGDFDGDGVQDLFLATGTAWYFSPGGAREWRFLSAKTDTIDQLLFGDFDGDGRTDVVAIHDGQFVVSWGGVSDWEVLNPNPTGGNLFLLPSAVTAMAVGDFDGNGVSDIFYADGQTWWVSYGGNTPFVQVQTSSFRRQDLLFGDFDGNGTTDVFSVGSVNWQVSYSPKGVQGLFTSWQPLRAKLTDAVQGLVVADFNGDGFADVAMYCGTGCLNISYGGTQDWANYSTVGSLSLVNGGVGHFSGGLGADILVWNGNEISVVPSGTGTPQPLSSQDMR
jgi:FG-GAP-like repeat